MVELAWTGLDVGGAHLKAARVGGDGRVEVALQVPCALWQGLDRLERALAEVLDAVGPVGAVAVTMTGELADLFADRADGVRQITACLTRILPDRSILFWTDRGELVGAERVAEQPLAAASANWLATATLVARRLGDALLVDIGSTTADLVLVAGGKVRARAGTDRERLAAEELVYVGATRTPLMALARDVPFRGERVPLMNEHFATTADVWRILELLPEDADQHAAADNGPKTAEASMRRLARMVGADLADASPEGWVELARVFARAQEALLLRAVERQLSRGLLRDKVPMVATGSGSFIVRRLAAQLERPCRDFAELVDVLPQARAEVDRCAPAVAVALIAGGA